ncbi:MAG TPA: DUF2125 domain-containing protein, partial [Afifellaceae bacterium]|nr:DUF2125 domain-containing protein [Afifellaceae bacterium]
SRADLAAPLRITGGPLPTPVDVTWSAAEIGIEVATPVPNQVKFNASDLQAAFGGIAVTALGAQAEVKPTMDRLGAILAFNAATSRLLWQDRQSDAANVTAQVWIDAPPEEMMGGTFDPRRSGLSIPELTVRLETGEALIQASGPVRFDRRGVMSGKLEVHVVGAGSLPAYFKTLPAIAQPAANTFVGGLLALGAPAALDGRDGKVLTLRIDGGVVRMGPVALAHIPPLF